jgi:hypothetical protein
VSREPSLAELIRERKLAKAEEKAPLICCELAGRGDGKSEDEKLGCPEGACRVLRESLGGEP